jgi:tRNA (guanine-N7-)-methyltransferase
MNWSTYFPAFVEPRQSTEVETNNATTPEDITLNIPKLMKDVEVADIGCGFGGLLVALAPKLPDKLLLGETEYPAQFPDNV